MSDNYYDIIKRPIVTENTFDLIETQNKLTFYVKREANKYQIKKAIEKMFDVRVVQINTMITPRGDKKAFVKLHINDSAADLAIELGIF